jgi:DNA excision repair protein ERCC-3
MSDSEANEEYANAEKLVVLAAQRESLLTTPTSSTPGADFSKLKLKPDHNARPCWTCPDGAIYLEAFHSLYNSAYDFLVAIAEPVARPEFLHEYRLTPYSLYAAVATNIETESIIKVLDRLSKNALPEGVAAFIRECTKRYGKAKLVLKHNKFYVESEYPAVLRELLRDSEISQARVAEEATGAGDDADATDKDGFVVNEKAVEMEEVSLNATLEWSSSI